MGARMYFNILLLAGLAGCGQMEKSKKDIMQPEVLYQYTKGLESVHAVFPQTADEITSRVRKIIDQAADGVAAIIAIPDDQRTFANTARALDTVTSNFSTQSTGIATLGYVSPDDVVREAANNARVEIQKASVDLFGQNLELYRAFKSYYIGNAKRETLTKRERYFIDETMKDFKRSGLDLPEDKRAEVKRLKKELGELSVTFDKNINSDASTITVTREGLAGLEDDFISALKKDDEGNYILGVDYPTYFAVMEHCTVEDTRKRLYKVFQNRAYPQNMEVLNAIIAKRDELAKLLGYKSYAHLNIDDEMAETPEKAETFINDLVAKAQKKADQEFERIKSDLAPGVTLSAEGKMYPWNGLYTSSWYKKKHHKLDEREVSEYFPMQQTIDHLLEIYEQFFELEMEREPIDGLWADDLILVKVRSKKDKQLLGYLILDLHPRANKYSHACHIGVSSALIADDGSRVPSLGVVLANFPKPTADKPALLQRSDVKTFFHEFGHAIHVILGATSLASFAGTNVKTDFVEMPSQMLEEWLHDPAILRQVSGHYKTGKPLPDSIIDTIIALKNFGAGSFVQGQSNYSLLALAYYAPGAQKDTDVIRKHLHERILKHSEFDPEGHFQASFGHLTGYGARYYGYLWSKVFALDLFNHIKKIGLLNPEIGTVYATKVIGKGGSQPPQELLRDFLGREPNQKAFLRDMGL